MVQTPRLNEILRRLRTDGEVRATALARDLSVTEQTLRRDLALLAATGEVERVHGGAVLPRGSMNTPYAARRAVAAEAKARIAAACAAEIPNGASLFLNIGTTTEAVARALRDHQDLMVITNNIQVAQTLSETAQVVLTGGALRAADGGLVGPQAAEAIAGYRADFAVVGCSALDAGGDVLDFDPEEVAVSRAILERGRTRVLVADAGKLERSAPVRICGLADVDLWITDAVPDALARRCQRWATGVRVV